MTRGGSQTKAHNERRCLVKGSGQSRYGLIRFCISPDGIVVPDIFEKIGGRGAWISADRECLLAAVKKDLFSRSFKTKTTIPANFIEQIESGLVQQLVSLIAIARKSGTIFVGAKTVGSALQTTDVALLLQARDGSDREKRNVGPRQLARYRFEVLDSHELAMAFGREKVIHAALTSNPITNRVYDAANRLAGVRALNNDIKVKKKNG